MDNLGILLIDMQKHFIKGKEEGESYENLNVLINHVKFFKSIKEKKYLFLY